MVNKDAWIKKFELDLLPPSLRDNTADVDRLIKGIRKALQTEKVNVDLPLIKGVASFLREHGYKLQPVLYESGDSWHLVELLPAQKESPLCGFAVDLGSSTIVVRLLDMESGEMLEESSFLNPQNEIGPDILTRIHFASQKGGLEKLQTLLIDKLNKKIAHMCGRHGIRAHSIMGMSVAGNTTMTHFFLGLDPFWICREPYIPVINRPDLIHGADLGLEINPRSPVLVFPNVGSYFGGDLIAGILASGMNHQREISVMVDVGTNAEVVLGNSEWLMGCAGAAGPALEGGVASMGMMAGPGVIDKVVIDSRTDEFKVRTIENRRPVGICGSGLIDLVAQLFLSGMIDLRGKYVEGRCGTRLREFDGIRHLVVVFSPDSATGEELTLSQAEIDAIIRSKAAMYTILATITNMVHVSMRDIKNFYIAGTFGSYIDPRSAITIGMIPDLPLEIYKPLGNTSLNGATRALLSVQAKDEIYEIRDRITYVELNVNQEFMNLFSAAKFIPHTERALFPSVRVG
ncbi:MAG: ASKHA domain-containing protein [Pseudomonadota bacterium]